MALTPKQVRNGIPEPKTGNSSMGKPSEQQVPQPTSGLARKVSGG